MISLILPYWDRKDAADRALMALDAAYADGPDMEVLIIDDGNTPRYTPPAGRLDVRVIYMPEKRGPLSPATCWNEGARCALGEYLAISCVEVIHQRPVLGQMFECAQALGSNAYVLAAAWCPELEEWHCHSRESSRGAPLMPDGFGRAFLGLMHRDLYRKAGGWNEEYRDGAGYEDLDFSMRLREAGAQPIIRDDLVVHHPKTGAQIRWRHEQFERNLGLYTRLWGAPCFA